MFSVALALVPLRNLQTYRPDLLYKEWQSQCFVCCLLLPGVVEEFGLVGQQVEQMTGEVSETFKYTYRKM